MDFIAFLFNKMKWNEMKQTKKTYEFDWKFEFSEEKKISNLRKKFNENQIFTATVLNVRWMRSMYD